MKAKAYISVLVLILLLFCFPAWVVDIKNRREFKKLDLKKFIKQISLSKDFELRVLKEIGIPQKYYDAFLFVIEDKQINKNNDCKIRHPILKNMGDEEFKRFTNIWLKTDIIREDFYRDSYHKLMKCVNKAYKEKNFVFFHNSTIFLIIIIYYINY